MTKTAKMAKPSAGIRGTFDILIKLILPKARERGEVHAGLQSVRHTGLILFVN